MFEICSDLSKRGIKIYFYFVNIQKRSKNDQMTKPFFSVKQLQTV